MQLITTDWKSLLTSGRLSVGRLAQQPMPLVEELIVCRPATTHMVAFVTSSRLYHVIQQVLVVARTLRTPPSPLKRGNKPRTNIVPTTVQAQSLGEWHNSLWSTVVVGIYPRLSLPILETHLA